VKHIQKGKEPEFFRQWKKGCSPDWNPDWAALDGEGKIKRQLMEHLVEEQGGICCYCNRELRDNDFHIEHFRPKDKYPKQALEYENLLISCQRQLQQSEPVHCGMKKGNWFEEEVTVSPLEPDCERLFEYLEDGRIRAAGNDSRADETIKRLGLDINKLRELRKAAISAVLDVENLENLKRQDLLKLIHAYRQRNNNNKFQPFYAAIIQILEGLL